MQTELAQFIRDQIRHHGPQSFAWFMEQALYQPEHGFYASGRAAIGRTGDYFTNVSVGPLFGQLFTAQFAEIWERLDRPKDFAIVEQGVHYGDFARDVLECAAQRYPEFHSALHYTIVEPFSPLQERQSQTLSKFERRVRWFHSLEELSPFTGIHFSNELLDSFPVHLIVSGKTGWLEKRVGLNENEFVFIEQPIVDSELKMFAETLPVRPHGYETEVNLAALGWMDAVSRKLTSGCVLVVDYGFTREQFYDEDRSAGTLQVRAQHRLLSSVFDEIGNADMTAHVDWTSLAERAERKGFRIHGFTDQHHFLTGVIAGSDRTSSVEPPLPADFKSKRALQTLLHPEMLGRAFHVLALEKDAKLEPLTGFQFARGSRRRLGL